MSSKYNVKKAAEFLGITEQGFRRAIKNNDTLREAREWEPVPSNPAVTRGVWSEEALEEYANSRRSVGRSDGRNKFVLYADPEEYKAIVKVLRDAGLNGPNIPGRANPPKGK